jgi:hypothetical protein
LQSFFSKTWRRNETYSRQPLNKEWKWPSFKMCQTEIGTAKAFLQYTSYLIGNIIESYLLENGNKFIIVPPAYSCFVTLVKVIDIALFLSFHIWNSKICHNAHGGTKIILNFCHRNTCSSIILQIKIWFATFLNLCEDYAILKVKFYTCL